MTYCCVTTSANRKERYIWQLQALVVRRCSTGRSACFFAGKQAVQLNTRNKAYFLTVAFRLAVYTVCDVRV